MCVPTYFSLTFILAIKFLKLNKKKKKGMVENEMKKSIGFIIFGWLLSFELTALAKLEFSNKIMINTFFFFLLRINEI